MSERARTEGAGGIRAGRGVTSLASLHLALVLSGAAGLIYQMSWTRLLQRIFGVGDLAVATVLATYFLGIGLGNAIAARYVRRVERPARVYALLELAVGGYALLSLAIVPGIGAAYGLLGEGASFGALTLVRFLLASLALLPPTVLMGATLPVVAEASREPAWSRSVTAFYTSNTLGAVLGAATAGFLLVPRLGTRLTVVTGALLSVAAAGLVFGLMRDVRKVAPSPQAEASATAPPPVALAATLAFFAGLAALGSEVLWTRVLRIIVHGTTPAFAAMLVNYLLGIAAGALLTRALSRRVSPAAILGASQSALVVLTALAMVLVPFVPRVIPILSGELDTVPHASWIVGLVSFALLFPLALALGTGLPATWAMIERGSDAGRGAAILLATNTLGGLVGSLATGFLLIPTLGTEAGLLALAAVNALVASLALRHAAPRGEATGSLLARVGALILPFALFTGVLVLRPSLDLRFLLQSAASPMDAVLHGPNESWASRVVFLREGRNTTATIIRGRDSLTLYNDGRPESGFSPGRPGFGPELVTLGGLPGVLAGRRDEALVIGLGAGHTAAMALASGFGHVRVIELEDAVVEASRLLYEARERPFPLDDPRAELVVDDARNQLGLTPPGSLDAVISQPSHPWLAGSSALYTHEFFLEVARALRDDGVFGLWVNLFRMDLPHLQAIVRTLVDVFPHVRGFVVESTSLVLMASRTPRPLGFDESARIRAMDAVGPFFAPYRLESARDVLARQELDEAATTALAEGGETIVDDRPLLELELAALPAGAGISTSDLDRALGAIPWASEPASEELLLARIELVESRRLALDRVARSVGLTPMVEARLLEARGDVTGALAAYDALGTPDARARAETLRFLAGLSSALLARAVADPVPSDLALRTALTEAPIRAEIVEHARSLETPLGRFVVASAAGCEAVSALAIAEREALMARLPEVAHVVFRCAILRGDGAEASHAEQLAWRGRTIQASELTQVGEAARAGGNGGLALLYFESALRRYPTATRAAIGLAELHQHDQRPEAAREVLLAAYRATSGLAEANARIVRAAADLGIALGSDEGAGDPGEAASSTSTNMPAPSSDP